MPSSPPTICHCGRHKQGGKCPACGGRKHRLTTRERGYDYAWQKFTKRIKAERPTCEDQAINHPGQVRASEEIHHIAKVKDAPHLRLEPSNVLALCGQCHDMRTAKGE